MTGRTPYGYTRANGLLVPDPVKAPVVRRIFQLYAEGRSARPRSRALWRPKGAPAPRRHGWSPNALQLILANPAYRGLVRSCPTRYKYGPAGATANGCQRTDSKQPCSAGSPSSTATVS